MSQPVLPKLLSNRSITVRSAAGTQTASDDLTFYSYQVWETAKDFFKHIKSDAVKPLGKLIIDEVRHGELSHLSPHRALSCLMRSTWVPGRSSYLSRSCFLSVKHEAHECHRALCRTSPSSSPPSCPSGRRRTMVRMVPTMDPTALTAPTTDPTARMMARTVLTTDLMARTTDHTARTTAPTTVLTGRMMDRTARITAPMAIIMAPTMVRFCSYVQDSTKTQ